MLATFHLALLLLPQQPTTAEALPQQASVPFTQPGALDGNGPVVFEARVEGLDGTRLARFVLDTGASRSLLDRRLASQLGLEAALDLPVAGVGGMDAGALLVPLLDVGGFEFNDFPATVLDLSFLPLEEGRVDGIFGSDLLQQCILEVDFERGLLHLSPPEWGDDLAGRRFLPLRWFFGLPQVEVDVCGLPAWFMVDTGNTALTVLHAPFFQRHFEPREEPRLLLQGVGGTMAVLGGALGRMELAGRSWERLAVLTPLDEQAGGLLDTPGVDGNLGMETLRHFRLTFDYARQRIGFAPGKEWPVLPPAHVGLLFGREAGRVVLQEIVRGGPAEGLGLRRGDTLISIDGNAVSRLGSAAVERALYGPPDSEAVLIYQRDDEAPARAAIPRQELPLFELRKPSGR